MNEAKDILRRICIKRTTGIRNSILTNEFTNVSRSIAILENFNAKTKNRRLVSILWISIVEGSNTSHSLEVLFDVLSTNK